MYTSCVAGHLTLPLTPLFPIASTAAIGNASHFAFADNSALPAGWNIPAAHRSIAAAGGPAAIDNNVSPANMDEPHLLAGMAAWGFDLNASEGTAGWLPGAAFGSTLLLVVGLVWFRRIFGIEDGKLKPKPKSAEDLADKPILAEAPDARSRRPSHGVKIGGDNVPGMSIPPPPPPNWKRGGKGIL